jgi:tRNA(Ile)-lysidine synthetase-like protein
VRVERNFDRLLFCRPAVVHSGAAGGRETDAKPDAYDYPVELPRQGTAAVDIPEIGSRFCLKLIDWRAAPRETRELPGVLDRDLLSPPFRLRNWRPGDAYRPKGHAHMQKVKRLFREFRIAARERPRWPVLTSGGRVAWVLGLPAAAEYAAGPDTRSALVIHVARHSSKQESP